jgi:hypothetical protein
VSHAQEIVHNFESLITSGEIYCRYVHRSLKLALGVVSEEGQKRYDARWSGIQSKLVFENAVLLNEFGETLDEVGPVRVQRVRDSLVFSLRQVYASPFSKRR